MDDVQSDQSRVGAGNEKTRGKDIENEDALMKRNDKRANDEKEKNPDEKNEMSPLVIASSHNSSIKKLSAVTKV